MATPAITTALLLLILLGIIIYFIWTTLLWATWNYTIPRIQNSINGTVKPFTNITWPTSAVFAFLLLFLAYPMGSLNMFGQVIMFISGMITGEKDAKKEI